MNPMSGTPWLLALTFLVATMLSIGMTSRVTSLRRLLASRGFLLRTLMANFVAVPLVGLILVRVLPLRPEAAAAIMLLACVPGGLGSVQFTSKVRGEEALPGATLVLLNVAAIAVSPAIFRAIVPGGSGLALPYGPLLGFFALCVLVPLGLGGALREKVPGVARRLAGPLGILGFVAFIAYMVVTRSYRREALAAVGTVGVAAMAALLVASMVAGWLLGGPRRETRQLLATATGMRHAALCLVMARSAPAAGAVIAPLVAFIALMVPANLLFTLYWTVRARIASRRGGDARKEKEEAA